MTAHDALRRTVCPACGLRRSAWRFHIPPRRIVACTSCHHEYVCSLDWDQQPSYVFAPDEADSINTDIDISYLLSVFERYCLFGCRLLDIGCGRGRIETRLLGLGWQPEQLHVIDASPDSVRHVREQLGLRNAQCRDAEAGLDSSWSCDCVLMIELLEHLWSPHKAIENAVKCVKPGSILIVRGVPNCDSLEAFLGAEKWKMRQVNSHVHFFCPDSMRSFLSRCAGIELLEWGCFLQPGYRFFDIRRVARNIGISTDVLCKRDAEVQEALLRHIRNAPLQSYKYWSQAGVSRVKDIHSAGDLEEYFDAVNLDYQISPDLGVVLRKR